MIGILINKNKNKEEKKIIKASLMALVYCEWFSITVAVAFLYTFRRFSLTISVSFVYSI